VCVYVCVCVHARARACVCVRVCMYVCTLKPRYYSWDLKLEDGCRRRRTETLEKETYAVISRKTRNPEKDTGWLQLEMLKKSEERSRREPKLIELICCIHIHTCTTPPTHTHICIHRGTHKIIHITQTYITQATHTHTHTHTHTYTHQLQKCTHDMWRIIKVGWNVLFCTDKFVLHKQEESCFLLVSTWTYFEWNYNTLDSKPPFLWQ
jgi:hypothetical protein